MKAVFLDKTVNRIIIGLGGQGCRIVDGIANYLDSHGEIPENEAFILIDSNDADLSGWCRDIKTVQPTIFKKNLPLLSRSIFTAANPWFPEKYLAIVGGIGVGQRRAFGKALYNIHREGIGELINKVAQDLIAKTNERSFIVIIVSSLGGGTGSSIIVDLSVDIRNWIQTYYKDPIILGFGILPSMDEENTNIGNAMATLKELHFILSQKEKKDKYMNPFDMFVLVERKASGVRDDEFLHEIAIRFLVDLGFAPGKKKKTEDKWIDLNDLMNMVTPFKSSFSSLGYHVVEFPANKILKFFKTEYMIEDMNLKLLNFQKEIRIIDDRIKNSDFQTYHIKMNIDKLNERINAIEVKRSWFSKEKAIIETRRGIELAEQEYRDIYLKKNELSNELKELEAKKIRLETELENLNAWKEMIYQQIVMPPPNLNMYQIRLSDEEIYRFRGREMMFDASNEEVVSNFKQVMEELGRSEEYDNHVYRPFRELLIAPLLNYEHKMKKEQINLNTLKILLEREFIEIDAESNFIVDEESKIDYVAAILSSHKSNIDEGKLGTEYAENILRKTISKHARLFPLNAPLDRFRVNFYTLLIGLQLWPLASGYPSGLTDKEKMQDVYKRFSNEELFMHHSLFLGDFRAFSDITGISLRLGDTKEQVESVVQFWKKYELVNREARWRRVPIMVAEILGIVEEFDNHISLIKQKLFFMDSFYPFSPMAIADLKFHAKETSDDLNKLFNSLNNYIDKFYEGKSNIHEFISQVIFDDTIDNIYALKIKNFLDITLSKIDVVLDKINDLVTLSSIEVPEHLQKIDESIKSMPIENQSQLIKQDVIEIIRNIEIISHRVPEMSKNLQQIEMYLGEFRGNVEYTNKKLAMIKKE